MSIAVADVRTDIQDKPRVVPPSSGPPEALGVGDGANNTFLFQSPNVLTQSPIVVYFGTQNSSGSNIVVNYTQIAASDGTHPWDLVTDVFGSYGIQFTAAVPPANTTVSARYMVSMFSDAELAGYLSRALAAQGGDDRKTLLQCKYDLIGVILMNDDKFRVLTMGDTKSDPTQIRMGLQAIQTQAYSELTNKGATSGPAVYIGSRAPRPYVR
jgi:hypothetical protein